jgi:hypothetical protein
MPVLFAMRAAMIVPARRQLRAHAAVRRPQPAARDKREAPNDGYVEALPAPRLSAPEMDWSAQQVGAVPRRTFDRKP